MQNKKSIWSIIILVCTVLTLILLVASIVTYAISIPVVSQAAKEAAQSQGDLSPAEIDMVVGVAVGGVIAALVLASIFDVFKIIGGFLFSLKGKWGIFCIVVAILGIISGVWGLISSITNKAGGATIAIDAVSLVVSVLFCVACFKHYQENKQ